jgi:hypothetical protein
MTDVSSFADRFNQYKILSHWLSPLWFINNNKMHNVMVQQHQSEFTKLRATIWRPRKPCKDQLLTALLWSIVIVLWCRVAGFAGFNFLCNYNCCLSYWVAHVLDPAQWKTATDCFINYSQFKDKLHLSYFFPSTHTVWSQWLLLFSGRTEQEIYNLVNNSITLFWWPSKVQVGTAVQHKDRTAMNYWWCSWGGHNMAFMQLGSWVTCITGPNFSTLKPWTCWEHGWPKQLNAGFCCLWCVTLEVYMVVWHTNHTCTRKKGFIVYKIQGSEVFLLVLIVAA